MHVTQIDAWSQHNWLALTKQSTVKRLLAYNGNLLDYVSFVVGFYTAHTLATTYNCQTKVDIATLQFQSRFHPPPLKVIQILNAQFGWLQFNFLINFNI